MAASALLISAAKALTGEKHELNQDWLRAIEEISGYELGKASKSGF